MDSDIGFALDPGSLVLVALTSLVAVGVVVLVVRALAPRRGWSADAAAALTWSSSMAVVAVLSLAWIAPWSRPEPRVVAVTSDSELGSGSYAPLEAGDGSSLPIVWSDQELLSPGILTLVWLPCVMALLWSVLHVLRSGTGHHSPLLGVPVTVAIPALWLVSSPLQITVFTVGVLGALSWAGLLIWALGQAAVAVGRSWVGDVGVWTGIALVAADAWPGYVGLVSPVVVAALVLFQQRRGARPEELRVS
ncbi:hypothetical protein ASG49_02115 [Marmoricola sp. Leaf446]|uniref:hypothetical protein n=1 Tax=Marmoricola sp. Leaf446 TaxID=1736379 RepID=UPI0006F6701A|nr:hypothetical protein [Marmoricola sp. Leaf446]KQT93795.1 hypothetical protein ASG49_02115 [Marmoricola sp. Leaf446]